ncbi:hypothetical protein, conserved [Trypanosoma brucei gambiense DAL972]|uniref:Fibronectin type-III domain-containing protein n=1 Tax=Trypanosoma brucei gambiense (strain MHOM/CI/86/DAL972) TaxID=679716 RepID=D0A782_TRYB9|nr:hypothetical protein, conserved [Trypanosoma brucei gambiense DAL972]CBH17533.1 hypothetical protein, conserved [Trypanosoma brucei gambiense DAL972]|eukprot:XP_011779797.1 hypothetical protein, conserved [Trypanosoma brucei gambiense DAL972]
MFESLYELFSTSPGRTPSNVVCNNEMPPALIVVMLKADEQRSHTSQSEGEGRRLLNGLMAAYPSSNYMFVIDAAESTSEVFAAVTGEYNLLRELSPKFCYVVFAALRDPEVVVPCTSVFNPAWVGELRRMLDGLRNPRHMVAELLLRKELCMQLEGLLRFTAECRWIGDESLSAKLSRLVDSRVTDLSSSKNYSAPSCGGLQVSCISMLKEGEEAGSPPLVLQTGIRIRGVVPDLTRSLRLSDCNEREYSPPLLLVVLHAGESIRENIVDGSVGRDSSVQELDCLLQQLSSSDEVFVSLGGYVVVPLCSAAAARKQWLDTKEVLTRRVTYDGADSHALIREMLTQALLPLRKWHRKHHTPAEDEKSNSPRSRVAILFYTPQEPCSVHQCVHSIVRQQLAFLQVPLFCITTPVGVDTAYKLLDISSTSGERCICTLEASCTANVNHDSECGGKGQACYGVLGSSTGERVAQAALTAIRSVTHLGVSVTVHSIDNSTEDTRFEVGDLRQGLDTTVLISRPVQNPDRGACAKHQLTILAYSVDKSRYDIVRFMPSETVKEVPSSEHSWWSQVEIAGRLLKSMPSKAPPSVSQLGNTLMQHSEEVPSLGGLAEQQHKLVEWLLSNYGTQELEGTPYTLVIGWCPSPYMGNGSTEEEDGWPTSSGYLSASPCIADPLVELRWTNFPFCDGAPVTTISAIISRTFPFEALVESTASNSLALETLRNDSAEIRLASMKHIPELREARARIVAFLSVDTSTGAMSLQQLVPAKTEDDVKGGMLHTFRSLRLHQMYCVVHLALRCSLDSSFFMQNDVIIADGITFITPRASVHDVRVTTVTHCRADVEWKGTATSVRIECKPMKWISTQKNSERSPGGISDVTDSEVVGADGATTIVEYSCDGFQAAVAGLQPFTLYHLRVTPIGDSTHGAMIREKLEEGEAYFATCVDAGVIDTLSVESIVPDSETLKLTVAHPVLCKTAAISRTRSLVLTITPTMSMSNSLDKEKPLQMRRRKFSEGESVVTTFTLQKVERVQVCIEFNMKLCFGHVYLEETSSTCSHTCGSDDNDAQYIDDSGQVRGVCVWFARGVSSWTKEVALCGNSSPRSLSAPPMCSSPTQLLDGYRISRSDTPFAEMRSDFKASSDLKEHSTEENVVVTEGKEGCGEMEWSESSIVSVSHEKRLSKYVVDDSDPSTTGEATRSLYCVFSKDPTFRGVRFLTDMSSQVLLASFAVGGNSSGYISAVIMPLNVSVDNLDGDNTSLKVSYAHVDRERPVTVKLVQHLEQRYQRVGRKTMHLYAVTDVCCRSREEVLGVNGVKTKKMLLSWTCGAQQEGSSLFVLIGSKRYKPKPNNTLLIDCNDTLVAAPVCFCGSNIIKETCSIYLVPPPPPLSSQYCTVRAVKDEALHIFITEKYCVLLYRCLACVSDLIMVLLHVGGDNATELPCSQQKVSGGETGVHLQVPLDAVDPEKNTVELCVEVRVRNSACCIGDNPSVSDWRDRTGFGGSGSSSSLISTNILKGRRQQPILLIPWSASESFDVPVASSTLIKNLQVTELHSTRAKLSWTTVPYKETADEKLGVFLTVQCAAAEGHVKKYKEYVVCSARSFLLRGLLPATPYHVELSLDGGCPPGRVVFVTPQDMEDNVLRKLIPSITAVWASRRGRNWQHVMRAACGGTDNAEQQRFVRLQLDIPNVESKHWTVSPCSAQIIKEEISGCGTLRLAVTAKVQVLLVAKSGKLLQMWSTVSGTQSQTVSFAFPVCGGNPAASWPHIELRMDSFAQFSSAATEDETGDEVSPSVDQDSWSFSEKDKISDLRAGHLVSRKHLGDRTNCPFANSHVTVHLVGCPQLIKVDENCCVVEWSGSCSGYAIHWRVGPSGVVNTEHIEAERKQKPSITVDVSALDTVVLLFSLHGADCASNCVLFAVLVPPKVSKQIGCCCETTRGLSVPTSPRCSNKGLIKVDYTRGGQPGSTLTDGESLGQNGVSGVSGGLCCTASVVDTSSLEWREGFKGLLKDEVCCMLLPFPMEVVWLNPVVTAFYSRRT